MEREPVGSVTVASVGYDAESLTLEVEFTNGRIYQYFGIPAEIHAEMMASSSKGRFLDSQIKKANYPFSRIA